MAYKKKKGWLGRVQYQYLRSSKVFRTHAEALRWEVTEKARLKEIVDAGGLRAELAPTVTVFDLAQDYLDFAKEQYVSRTYGEKVVAFRELFKFVPKHTILDRLTKMQVFQALRQRATDVSGNAANRDRKNLVAAWNWGVDYMGLPKEKNPFDVRSFPEERKVRYVPPPEDFWRVYDSLKDEQHKLLLFTFLHTAARRDEVFRMKWSDIDFRRGTITLWTRKRAGGNLEADLIPMTDQLGKKLAKAKRTTDNIRVFPSPDWTLAIREKWMSKRIPWSEIGVKPFGFHAIRHLSASMLDAAGQPVTVIQAILRHKSSRTTDRYLHSLHGVRASIDSAFDRTGIVTRQSPKVINMKRG